MFSFSNTLLIWSLLQFSSIHISAEKTSLCLRKQSQAAQPRRLLVSFKAKIINSEKSVTSFEMGTSEFFSTDNLTGVHNVWLWLTACVCGSPVSSLSSCDLSSCACSPVFRLFMQKIGTFCFSFFNCVHSFKYHLPLV